MAIQVWHFSDKTEGTVGFEIHIKRGKFLVRRRRFLEWDIILLVFLLSGQFFEILQAKYK